MSAYLVLNLRLINESKSMNNKVIGIVLIAVGAALGIWGYNVFDSAGAQISSALIGNTPIEAWLGMLGEFICVATDITKVK
jgi:hypothetical protein